MSDLLHVLAFGYKVVNSVFGKPSKCIICTQEKGDKFSINDIHNRINSKYYTFMSDDWIIFNFVLEGKVSDSYRESFYGRHYNTVDGQLVNHGARNHGLICSECFNKKFDDLERRFTEAYSIMNNVKTYPSTFHGSFHIDESFSPIVKTYSFSGGKWNTVNKMKFWAVWEGYDIIYNMTYDYNRNTATGVFAKLNSSSTA